MANVAASIRDIKIIEGFQDSSATDSVRRIKAVIYCDNGATAITTGSDVLRVAVDTALQKMRDGATITLRSAALFQPGQDATRGLGATIALSSNNADLTLVDVSDWSTGRTLAASGSLRPFGLYVLADLT